MAHKLLPLVTAIMILASHGVAHADDAEDKAVAFVEKLGGFVSRAEVNPGPVLSVQLNACPVKDAELKELAALKNLETLDLMITRVTDAGVKELVALTTLKNLRLDQTQVTDEGLKDVARLTNPGSGLARCLGRRRKTASGTSST